MSPDGEAIGRFARALARDGFEGEIETDSALRAAMSTDNSVYQIFPDIVVAPQSTADVVVLIRVIDRPDFAGLPLTARGGGTGTNGQSLNRGIVIDFRRHMSRLLDVNVAEQWADVEPGMVLDDLNEQLLPHGLFFAPETSTSTRCTIGGMVSTDASGKGSRIYGKTSDNILGIEIAKAEGLMSSLAPAPDWAGPMLAAAEAAAREGRDAFIAKTPRLNRRFTGYDLERACRDDGRFEWWRLFLGAEGTLGPITRIRVKLRRIEPEKRLIVATFATFRDALAAATPLLQDDPTAIEVMDEWVQQIAAEAGILRRLPDPLRPQGDLRCAYVFLEFNGEDCQALDRNLDACRHRLATLSGAGAIHVARDRADIRELWAIRSAGVGLLGKVDGPARPVAFVEDCVVPPQNLPDFLDGFLAVLKDHGLGFGIYGHVDVGCLHIRPALNIDSDADRAKLVSVSDAVFALTRRHGGIFWGEHGKGVRGAYVAEWLGPQAYAALQGVKAAFDPKNRFNPGKLVGPPEQMMDIAGTAFRPFNAAPGDPLAAAFRCNGNAQCLSYAATTPMCPSFKASGDLRHSPKGRADALRAWKTARERGTPPVDERNLMGVLDTCLGCKACASTCPIQVDIPQMRSAFYADFYRRNRRPLADRLTLLGERLSPWLIALTPVIRPIWSKIRPIAERLMNAVDLPDLIAAKMPAENRIAHAELGAYPLASNTVLVWQDWFTALFDEGVQRDTIDGLRALGYHALLVDMIPAGKAARSLGDNLGFDKMATVITEALERGAKTGLPMIGIDPAFVMTLRQEYAKAGYRVPAVMLPQEFLAQEVLQGRAFPRVTDPRTATLLMHCTETTALPSAGMLWRDVFHALGVDLSIPTTGCCGMAGLFGHQKRHQTVSRRLFDLSWKPQLEKEADGLKSSTGYSCRCQTERMTGNVIRHPLGLIAAMFP
ncbi:FAD-binding and (Fe-S)-binding domain-containing protein [Neorhizobium alkalisoli]|uniref:FAD/FMN-containing dehydrogenase n=1 Tax=Neorhizobium alkalisoli TaxID=528178 RepID=A0A561QAP2_9HYPH|nr:FAD-binding and (Fe-S)-binding domain-containing protein [Neorhizobium alkalisoli]TWF47417.1 FAD/FMN-containing dehydrogenase [Neorhizobium alkalisoli]